jgi:hypothetical protein
LKKKTNKNSQENAKLKTTGVRKYLAVPDSKIYGMTYVIKQCSINTTHKLADQ